MSASLQQKVGNLLDDLSRGNGALFAKPTSRRQSQRANRSKRIIREAWESKMSETSGAVESIDFGNELVKFLRKQKDEGDKSSSPQPLPLSGDRSNFLRARANFVRLSPRFADSSSDVLNRVSIFLAHIHDVNDATVYNLLGSIAHETLRNENDCPLNVSRSVLRLFESYLSIMDATRYISFDAEKHVYTYHEENGDKYEIKRSVTQALDMIFGSFDADLVAKRMILSAKWKKNVLYNELNFDEFGNERNSDEVVELLKNRWNNTRNKGTALHGYIESLSRTRGSSIPTTVVVRDAENDNNNNVDDDDAANDGGDTRVLLPDNIVVVNEESKMVTPIKRRKIEVEKKDDDAKDNDDNDNSYANGLANAIRDIFNDQSYEKQRNHGLKLYRRLTNAVAPSSLHERWREFVKNTCFYGARHLSAEWISSSHGSCRNNNDNVCRCNRNQELDVGFLVDSDENVVAFDRFNRQRLRDGWLLLATEYSVYDRQASLGGSIDAIYTPYPQFPHLVVLVDWKRCEIDFGTKYYSANPSMRYQSNYTSHYPKANYWKYAMQLNVYRELFERMFADKMIVLDMLIVSLPAGSVYPFVYSVPRINDAQLFVDELRRVDA